MMEIKIIVALATVLIGFIYARKELAALYLCITEKEYISFEDFKMISANKKHIT